MAVINLDLARLVCSLAEEAGKLVMQVYQEGSFRERMKSDGSPVTAADEAAHGYLIEQLATLEHQGQGPWPIVSEEDGHERAVLPSGVYWLIDPLDGTRDFLARTGDFTVNVALIDDGQAVLGVLVAPYHKKSYYGVQEQGAYLRSPDQDDRALKTRPFQSDEFILVVSRSRFEAKDWTLFHKTWPQAQVLGVGSALKFGLIAEGLGDLHIRQGFTSAWDTAAGQVLLEQAGGSLLKWHDGSRLCYEAGRAILNEEFIALGDSQLTWTEVRAQFKGVSAHSNPL